MVLFYELAGRMADSEAKVRDLFTCFLIRTKHDTHHLLTRDCNMQLATCGPTAYSTEIARSTLLEQSISSLDFVDLSYCFPLILLYVGQML